MIKVLTTITLTHTVHATVASATFQPPKGRIVGVALKVPTLGAGTAKVGLVDADQTDLILLPDTVLAAAASAGTKIINLSATDGEFYPQPSDRVTATVTCTDAQAATRVFELTLLIDEK